MNTPLQRAVKILGGLQAAADALSRPPDRTLTKQAIHGWLTKGNAPAERILDIEHETLLRGKIVTRYELRPDVYGGGSDPRT